MAATLLAELPPQSPSQLEQGSDLIVTGVVKRIYTSDEARDRGMVDTRYLLEIAVERVEKGQAAKSGEILFVRGWRAKNRPDGWVGPGGHMGISSLKPGQKVRAYLDREDDGGHEPLLPNGFQPQ